MKTLQNIKKWVIVAVFVLTGLGNTYLINNVFADNKVPCLTQNCSEYGEDLKGRNVANVSTNIINTFIGIIGFLAVLVVIYGGFLYTTSAGDASKVTKAKNAIMYGVIGVVVALMAYAIVNFVLSSVIK